MSVSIPRAGTLFEHEERGETKRLDGRERVQVVVVEVPAAFVVVVVGVKVVVVVTVIVTSV